MFEWEPLLILRKSLKTNLSTKDIHDPSLSSALRSVSENMHDATLIQSQRISRLNRQCQIHQPRIPRVKFQPRFHRFLLEPQTGLAYCHVPKVASSFWYSIFSAVVPGVPKNFSCLHDIMLSLSTRVDDLPQNASKMIFVRHPLKRLVSAYAEKIIKKREKQFLLPIEAFLQKQGLNISDLNFQLFVKFVAYEIRGDIISFGTHHWVPYARLCQICHTR
ncbi:hypothetical protein TCAL_17430 [Tigriopus californicus]|uniref:Carbohydrate sulfotransferase n=1 Tax=Tigriopus californicus TaxID=6832 RepID=A0A553P8I6_TIGCA|nr:hypothetical protein TCAL_17430 [Tigriopus californicus]|eukprot:TCALIF_14139-PA protein Name:"Similar to Chst14 Carbohydrate sulfotransferase 14 (Mus musculus)" AED:0.02 eAED:0.03 QI:0/-1/0/1/-1/1/1/0/218